MTKDDFHKLLQDDELYEEIRVRLRNAKQLINYSKLSGKNIRSNYYQNLINLSLYFLLKKNNTKKVMNPESNSVDKEFYAELKEVMKPKTKKTKI